MSEKIIKGVGDYLNLIDIIHPSGERAFFRGQRNSRYGINSSLYRLLHNSGVKSNDVNKYEFIANRLFSEFKTKYRSFPEVALIKDYQLNDIDIQMLAQHYGLATRMIDWTTNPLVALYFATEPYTDKNKERPDFSSIFMIKEERKLKEAHLPITVIPEYFEGINKKNKTFTSEQLIKSINDEINTLSELKLLLTECYPGEATSETFSLFYNRLVKLHNNITLNTVRSIDDVKVISAGYATEIILKMLSGNYIPTDENSSIFLNSFYERFLNTGNLYRGTPTISLSDDIGYFIEPLPFNTRLKNQQGVLQFSNSINDEVYSASLFNDSNTICCLDSVDKNPLHYAENIIRVDIHSSYVEKIHDELSRYGMTRDFIYPELGEFTTVMQERIIRDCV